MHHFGKLLSVLLALVLAVSLLPAALAADGETDGSKTASKETGKIVILHTNDVHCQIEPKTTEDGAVKNMGYATVAAYKAAMEAEYGEGNVTLVDAGDHVQGDLVGSLSKGEYIIRIMNAAGYDLAVPGNHEFDYQMETFRSLVEQAEYPYLSCNFMDLSANQPMLDGYAVVAYGDVKVGYVGVATPQTFTTSTPAYFQDENGEWLYSFSQDDERTGGALCSAVQESVDAARAEGADYVVAICHLGTGEPYGSAALAAGTTGIDVLLDGHSHSVVPGETLKNKDGQDVLVNQTGTKLANIGKIVIDTATGEISAELVSGLTETDETVSAVVEEIKAEYSAQVNEVIAKSEAVVTNNKLDENGERIEETTMGNFCADAYRVMSGAEIAILQDGGIRDSFAIGDLTRSDVIKVNPWFGSVCTVEVSGQTLLDALEMGARKCPEGNGGFFQVSGMSYTINIGIPSTVATTGEGLFTGVTGARRVCDVMIGDEPLDPEKTYILASSGYILKNAGDGMSMFADATLLQDEIMVDSACLIDYITKELDGVVPASYGQRQNRISVINEPAETEAPAAPAFSDVTEANWHYEFVTAMAEAKVVSGYADGTFKPGSAVTWGEALKMVLTYAGYGEQSPIEGGAWASGYAAKALEEKLIDAEVELDKNITRVEMCQLLAKALQISASEQESAFPDTTDGYVVALAELNVVSGNPDGGFNPDGELTRAELCKILTTAPKAA